MRRKGLLLVLLLVATVSGAISRYFVYNTNPSRTEDSAVEDAPENVDASAPQDIDPQFVDLPNHDIAATEGGEVDPSFVAPSEPPVDRLRLHIANPSENDIAAINTDSALGETVDTTSTPNDTSAEIANTTSEDIPEVPLTSSTNQESLVTRWQDLTRATTLVLLGASILLIATRWLLSGNNK